PPPRPRSCAGSAASPSPRARPISCTASPTPPRLCRPSSRPGLGGASRSPGTASSSALAEPAGYRVFRALARFLVAVFYRRVEVAGLGRLPLSGAPAGGATPGPGLGDGCPTGGG